MKENKLLSVLAGGIIGFLLGTLFYLGPTKLLFSGPIVNDDLFLPSGMQQFLIGLSAKFGGIVGFVIGILIGYSIPITLPRGHMSKTISSVCFVICTIMAFWQHGHFLAEMTAGRILITLFYVFILFLFAIPIGGAISFIERIRE